MNISTRIKLVLEAAKRILSFKGNVLSDIRMINVHAGYIKPKNQYREDMFVIFQLIDSETDEIPTDEEVRKRFTKDYLKKLDKKADEIINFYKKDLMDSCRQIIEKYGK